MTEKNLPFFEMFALYRPDPELSVALELETWTVTGAVMDRHARTIRVELLTAQTPEPELLRRVESDLAQIYRLRAVTLHALSPEPAQCAREEGQEEERGPEQEEEVAALSASEERQPIMSEEEPSPANDGPPSPYESATPQEEHIFQTYLRGSCD